VLVGGCWVRRGKEWGLGTNDLLLVVWTEAVDVY
jgi:hypothetical protein